MSGSGIDMSGFECLVVMEEAPVRALVEALLTRRGMDVIGTTSADEALALLGSEPDRFDAIIADAETVAEQLGRLIALSGGRPCFIIGQTQERDLGLSPGALVHHLSKPFSPPELVMAVVAALAEGDGARGRGESPMDVECIELDVCSGSGHSTCLLADAAADNTLIVGIDRNTDAIMLAAERVERLGYTNIRFVVADVVRLPFCERAFRAVHGADMLRTYGVGGCELAAAHAELARVVSSSPDGSE